MIESNNYCMPIMETSRSDTELLHKMAHLDIKEIGDCSAQNIMPESSARLLKYRKPLAPEPSKFKNRRVIMKPRKNYLSATAYPKQFKASYLNKKIKTRTQSLETIYEEPKSSSSNSDTIIGKRIVKRRWTFEIGSHYTKEKINKGMENIKKVLGNKTFPNKNKIPMNVFLKTIECSESGEVMHSEINLTEESDSEMLSCS